MKTFYLTPAHGAVLYEDAAPALIGVPAHAVPGVSPGDLIHHPDALGMLRVIEGQRWLDDGHTVLEIPVEVVEADA